MTPFFSSISLIAQRALKRFSFFAIHMRVYRMSLANCFGGVMVIQTNNGKISSDYGMFELASYAQFTRATVY